MLNKCEAKDKEASIEKVHTFCNDLMSKESIKEKPPIYLLATMVDINRGKNQEEALKVSSISLSKVSHVLLCLLGLGLQPLCVSLSSVFRLTKVVKAL